LRADRRSSGGADRPGGEKGPAGADQAGRTEGRAAGGGGREGRSADRAAPGLAFIEALIGASQSGKSTRVKNRLAGRGLPPCRLIWDFKREYRAFGQVTSDILQVCAWARAPSFSIVFQPSFDQEQRAREFGRFCDVALATVTGGRRRRCLLAVEELAFVTRPSWSPAAWAQCTCIGMGLGLSVIGTSQHPAQVDKNFFGNTTAIYCYRLTEWDHVQKMARVLRVAPADILQLPAFSYLARSVADPLRLERGTVAPGVTG
jgi:hypothetical protein